jgi:hypothetical protein
MILKIQLIEFQPKYEPSKACKQNSNFHNQHSPDGDSCPFDEKWQSKQQRGKPERRTKYFFSKCLFLVFGRQLDSNK